MKARHADKKVWVALISLTLLYAFSLNVFSASGNVASGKFGPDEGEDTVAYTEGAATDMAKESTSMMIRWMVRNPTVYDASASPPIPDTGWRSITIVILKVLVVPYQILILLTGIYITYVSIIPRKRAFAKNYLLRLIVGLVLTTLSPVIYQVILEMEHFLLFELIRSGTTTGAGSCATVAGCPAGPDCVINCMDKIGKLLTFLMTALFVWPLTCTIGILALIIIVFTFAVVWSRFVIVAAFGVIFPATVFLYMWNYTAGIGRKLMKYTFMWIFMPIVQALFLVVMVESAANLKTMQAGFLTLGGFLGVLLSPLIMTGMLKVAGGVTALAGSKFQSPLLTGAGHLMYGMGPGALASAGSQAAYRRAARKEDGGSGGGSGSGQDRLSMGPGVFRGAVAGFRQGGVAGALKGAAAGAWGTPSDATKKLFEGGIRQLTNGKSLQCKALGLAQVVGASLRHVAGARLLRPAGQVLSGMFHKRSDLAPAWIADPLRAIADGLSGNKPFLHTAKELGKSIGVVDKKTGKLKLVKLAVVAGIGMALFTPVGWVGLGLGVGLPLAAGFYLGPGLSLRKVTEAYGAGRASGKGVIRSALSGARAGLNLQVGKLARNLSRLNTVRQRVARALKKHIGSYEDRLKNIHSGAKVAVDKNSGNLTVELSAQARAKLTNQQQQELASIEQGLGGLNANMQIGAHTLGSLVTQRNDLDARIGRTETAKAKAETLANSVEGIGAGERAEGLDTHTLLKGDKDKKIKGAGELDEDSEKELNKMNMTFGTESLSVQDVTGRAQALMTADPNLTQQQAVDQILTGHVEGMSLVDDQGKQQRIADAKAAHQAGDNNALQAATHREGIAVPTPGTKALTDAQAIYTNAEQGTPTEPGIDAKQQSGEIDEFEADARKDKVLEAIGVRDLAAGRRVAAAEVAMLRNPKGMTQDELTEGREAIEEELVRKKVLLREPNGDIVRNRQAENDREALMMASYDDFTEELTSSSSDLVKREARIARKHGKYRSMYAQFVQADLSESENRRNHEEYMERIRENPVMQQIMVHDDERSQAVEELMQETIRGDESPEELQGKRERIDKSLQGLGRSQYLRSLTPAGRTKRQTKEMEKLERDAMRDLQALGLDPVANKDIVETQTTEADRSKLLATRVVDTHQFAHDGDGNITHVANPGVHYGKDWSKIDLKGIANGTASGTKKDKDGNDMAVTPGAVHQDHTVETQELYDYMRNGEKERMVHAQQEVYASTESSGGSPEIAFHWKEGDRDEYVPLPQGQTGDYTANAQGGYDYTPGQGTHDKQQNECWVSTVPGLTDEAAKRLDDAGIKTQDDFVANVPNHRREAARLRRMADTLLHNKGAQSPNDLTEPADKRQYDKLMAESKKYDDPAAQTGVAWKDNEQALAANDEITLKLPDGTDTTMEDVIDGVDPDPNVQTTPPTPQQRRKTKDMIDLAYEILNPRFGETTTVKPRVRRKKRDWRVDQARVENQIAETQAAQRNPVRTKLNRLVDDIEEGRV